MVSLCNSYAQCDFISAVAISNTGNWGNEMSWELYGPEPNSENIVASFQGVNDYSNSVDSLCLKSLDCAVIWRN